jgi:FGGY-family pentulose kinase
MAGKHVIGLDVGTQSLRAMVFDLQGTPLGSAAKAYPTYHDHVAWAEQEPGDWWSAAVECTHRAVAEAGVEPSSVVGLSVDSTSCTVLPVRRDGSALRRALLWMDVRSVDQAARVTRTKHPRLKYVSWVESPEWMIPKALWLKENQPSVFEEADLVIECQDWLLHRLTGRWVAALNQCTCKWNYAGPDGGWPVDLLKQLEFSELLEKWPEEVLAVGAPVGTLTVEAAAELGLSRNCVVAQGGIDAYMAMLGLGVTSPGQMALVMGTSTCHMALGDTGLFETHVWGPYPDALLPGTWVLEGGQTTTGAIVNWFRNEFGAAADAEAAERGIEVWEVLDEKAAAVPPGSEGLVLLDYFQGNRTPLRDPKARGAVVGLSLKHTAAHLFRAIYEGTACGTRHILEDLQQGGFRASGIYACGGGSKSALWLQIHADVCGVPLYLTRVADATCLGTAICAAAGAAAYGSVTEAAGQMVHIERQIDPDPANRDAYDFLYHKYVELYPRTRETMHDLADHERA